MSWFPRCKSFYHGQFMTVFHHYQRAITECGAGKRCVWLSSGLRCKVAPAYLCEAASPRFCLSTGHLWTDFPSSASLPSALLRRTLQPPCPWKSLSGHRAGNLGYLRLLHEPRRWIGAFTFLEMEALLWEWSLAVFLERVCDTKMALGKLPDVTWKKDGTREGRRQLKP